MARITRVACLLLAHALVARSSSLVDSRFAGGSTGARSTVSFQDIATLEPRRTRGTLMGTVERMGVAVALEMLASFVGFEADRALVSGVGCSCRRYTVAIASRWLHN